jgi:hypothetical protein
LKTPKRTPKKNAPAPSFDAPFAPVAVFAADVPSWTIHPALWLQPEAVPHIPRHSGLPIGRTHMLEMPDFVYPHIGVRNRRAEPAGVALPVAPIARPALPQSNLAPTAWHAGRTDRGRGMQ